MNRFYYDKCFGGWAIIDRKNDIVLAIAEDADNALAICEALAEKFKGDAAVVP